MTDRELNSLKNNVAERLADYANCDSDSAFKFFNVVRNCFSCEGAMLYNISDNLSDRGY